MKKYVIGIDVGTTGTKAMVVDLKGNILGSSYKAYPLKYSHPGWAEAQADTLTDAAFTVVREAVKESHADPAEIASVSFSVQRASFALTDENDEALDNTVITWLDTRGEVYLDEINERFNNDEHAEISGMPPRSVGPYANLYWLCRERPDFVARAKHLVSVDGYIMRKFGAEELCNERTCFQASGMLDVRTMEVSDEVCRRLGYERSFFPKLVSPGEIVGKISPGVSEITGLSCDTLIIAGSGDQQCGAVGCGLVNSGEVTITLGTGGFIIVGLDNPDFKKLKGLMIFAKPNLGVFEAEGVQNSGATCYRWAKEVFFETEALVAEQQEEDPYDAMNRLCEKSSPGANGVIFHAGLFGMAFPSWNGKATASILGLKPSSKRSDVLRAVMEGITFETRYILDAIKATGVGTGNVYTVTGGAMKSPLWRQIVADILGAPIRTLETADAAVIGAAGLAAIGAGMYRNLDEVVENMVHFGDVVKPVPENVEIYNKVYAVYDKIYEILEDNGVYDLLNNLCE